ncbi:MAG: LPS export ABC transporter permease LptG [Pseudomonadota bacterium]
MKTLTRYIARLFLSYLVGVLFGFVALLQAVDLLKNAEEVARRHGESLGNFLYYVVLRLPETAGFLLPLCTLVAALLTLGRMAQHSEIVALKAAGVPVWRVLKAFWPAALLVAVVQFAVSDGLTPLAQRAMERWDESAELARGADPLDGDGVWLHEHGTVAHIQAVRGGGTRLYGLTLYLRDGDGNLTERLQALTANYQEGSWQLAGVTRTIGQIGRPPQVETVPDQTWPIALTPAQLDDLSTQASGLGLVQLYDFAGRRGLGVHPRHYYETWLNKRIAGPFAAFLMILLAAPMARNLSRTGGVVGTFALAVGFGMAYLITDGIVFTLGETGAFPPILAAWVPIGLFGCLGGALLLHIDS